MSKITFRADDDLVERLEALDASKSEVMREALRAYLDGAGRRESASDTDQSVDDVLAARVDDLIEARLDDALGRRTRRTDGLSVTVTVDDVASSDTTAVRELESGDGVRKTPTDETPDGATDRATNCGQCGESIDADHVYCPNCGEKSSHRTFCECGDELRSDWAFCPSCGRRTPAADVLDRR
ncbi:Ribbon-helix-helix protein, copG family [Halogranum amylolyticum]|uniref:Ribbon-helix-helix protein, copG family n=1 Tax=Halogranum amylolyticum TaxID=660520 RepID=A0A1H8PZ11_9EURY|nr:zinc ribbon domain-containing protein [Halogranum amylolyticum]SEO46978.1 Ribbon-helix-helix protein, copG family [Halogranum amylolyticum]